MVAIVACLLCQKRVMLSHSCTVLLSVFDLFIYLFMTCLFALGKSYNLFIATLSINISRPRRDRSGSINFIVEDIIAIYENCISMAGQWFIQCNYVGAR
jgi:predicted LPLAT superfamily acyltransferase